MKLRLHLKKLFLYSFAILIIMGSIILWADYTIKKNSKGLIFNSVEEIPFRKTAILLGTNKFVKSGYINLYYKYRIEAATALFKAGKIQYIVVSGDNGQKDYNEPEQMKEDLMKNGIPETAIFLDFAGFRTLDSIVRMKEIFGQTAFTIISQQFHNERALYLAKKENLDAVAFNAKDVSTRYGLKVIIREKFARVKVFVDVLTGKEPKFLGEKVLIP